MPRADLGYPHNFMVDSWIFKDDESETDAKTKNRHQVCPLLAWRVHAQSPLLAHFIYIYIWVVLHSTETVAFQVYEILKINHEFLQFF